MPTLTSKIARELAQPRAGPCVSLYLPTGHGPGAEHANRLRFEALVGQAAERLARSAPGPDGDALVADLRALAARGPEGASWSAQLAGVAAFASPAGTRHFQLPTAVPELAVVSDSFHLRPLLGMLQANRSYYLLALSQHQAAFHRGGAEGLVRVQVPGLPTSLEDALGLEERRSYLTFHSAGAGAGTPIFHGHGADRGPSEEDLLRYFRAVDHALWQLLREETAPLVLAAPVHYHAPWKLACRYPHLLGRSLSGNFERSSPAEVHQRAWPLVQELVHVREAELIEEYGSLAAHGRGSSEVSTVARFAVQGRVRVLLLAEGANLWGRLDRGSGAIELTGAKRPAGGDDLLDDIAEAVILRGGEVLTVAADRLPASSPAVALLRW